MGQEGHNPEKEKKTGNEDRKRKIEEETGAQSKKACIDNEVCIRYLGGENTGIAVLSLNRPAARNALSCKIVEELQTAIADITEVETVRCLVLASQVEGVFCAGADLKERCRMSQASVAEFLKKLNNLVTALEDLPVPVIAVVEGPALGGGLELILGCDMRVGTTSAMFGLPETGIGVIPGAGGTVRLGGLVGWGRARQMVLTGCRVGGSQAEKWGLLNTCVEAGAGYNTALEMARKVATGAPLAVKMAKVALRSTEKIQRDAALRVESSCYQRILSSSDRLEGIRAWADKRKPIFRGK